MAKQSVNNLKLGAFVLGGLLFLVLLLYMIGKNRNLFGATYVLKARFENVQGLMAGNNVRFSGIQSGTVKKIVVLNDTAIEVTMMIEKRMLPIIRKNAIASIGTEGLVGNKVVNIVPAREPAMIAVEGDMLVTKKSVDTDEMLQTLYKTNNDVANIAANLKLTVQNINNSNALWNLLNDKSIPGDVKFSLSKIRSATVSISKMSDNLDMIIADVRNGKGSAGALLKDTSFSENLNDAVVKIKNVGDQAESLGIEINKLVADIRQDVTNGKGTVKALLKDSMMTMKLDASLDNIQKGTDGFNQNMEALKSNFLFRGYFRRQEKQRQKSEKKNIVIQ